MGLLDDKTAVITGASTGIGLATAQRWSSDHSELPSQSLTDGERRVAYLIAEGHTDKAAAKALGISVNTVGTHLRSAYSKLRVQSRVQLVNALRERGELN